VTEAIRDSWPHEVVPTVLHPTGRETPACFAVVSRPVRVGRSGLGPAPGLLSQLV
jgi:hypothetical protein